MSDLISRQAAIDAIRKDMYADKDYMSAIICDGIEDVLNSLPSAQPEIIHCKDCKYYTFKPGPNSVNCYVKHCTRSARASTSPDDYCSRAERKG